VIRWNTSSYLEVFARPSFRRFWLGFTFSAMGDAMTQVALIWFVYQSTRSAQAVGWLLLCSAGPMVFGGLLAGWLLDRFDRRAVLLADSTFRGVVVALVPVLFFSGHLALWHVYLVAAVHGFLAMIPLAGGPSLMPSLLPRSRLATGNALEALSYTLSGALGPPAAGLLIARFGAPSVLVLDAISYGVFALLLTAVRTEVERSPRAGRVSDVDRLRDAVSLLLRNRVLLSTTLMFMTVNVGEGLISVWLPVYSDRVLHGGPETYGVLLGAIAVGEMAGAVIAGGLGAPLSLGVLTCLTLVLSGVSLGLVLVGQSIWWAIAGLLLFGLFSAPPTIWTQTLRMQIIPEPLRGRTFALLRTLSRSSVPVANAGGGALLLVLATPAVIGFSAVLVGIPGVFGYGVRQLRSPVGASPE
jgi:MFS family permease